MSNKIKLDLAAKNVTTKVADGNTIEQLLQADADAQVKAAGIALAGDTSVLSNANTDNTQKHIAAKTATDVLLTKETAYDITMKAAAAKVIEIYPNNPDKYTALGFHLGGTAAAAVIPPQVSGLSVTHSEVGTENDLHWNAIKGTKMYKVQQCANADPAVQTNWVAASPDFSFKSKVTATGINPLVQTWFRIASVNAAGQGVWSNPAKVSA